MDAKIAYALGMMFQLGKMYSMQDLVLDEDMKKKFREELHPRDEDGKFVRKGNANMKMQYRLKADEKKRKEGKAGYEDKWVTEKEKEKHQPNLKPKESETPHLDKFAKRPPLKVRYLKDAKPNEMYRKTATIDYGKDGNKDKSKPQCEWRLGNRKLSPEEALELESALKEDGRGNVLRKEHTSVKVRVDFASGEGQVVSSHYKGRKVSSQASGTSVANSAEKYDHVVNDMASYDKALDIIAKGISEDRDRRAYLAYFMHRTRCRIGGNSEESEGASTLRKEHLKKIDGDNMVFEFDAKNGFWHVELEDRILANFLRHRIERIGDDESLFGVNQNEENAYLAEVGKQAGMRRFENHDFRRLNATLFAKEFLENDKTEYNLDSEDDLIKRAKAALLFASNYINDLPNATTAYVAPQVLFGNNERLVDAYMKFSSKTK